MCGATPLITIVCCLINPLKTKRGLSNIKTQGVPRSKHPPPQFKKPSFDDVSDKSCRLFLDKYKTHKRNVSTMEN
jgi:hypothetical protein